MKIENREMMKKVLIVVTTLLCPLVSMADSHAPNRQLDTPSSQTQYKADVDARFTGGTMQCATTTMPMSAVTDFGQTTEFWRICNLDAGDRIIIIESYQDDTLYNETYFEENNQLVYAHENQKYVPINHFIQQIWAVQFYIKDNEVVYYISLGHGKTETDDWRPDSILTMYRKRLSELNGIQNNL